MSSTDISKYINKLSWSSLSFKFWVLGLFFFMILFHFYDFFLFPEKEIIPKEVILGVALVIIAYLWLQELLDRSKLVLLNRAILDAKSKLEDAEIDTIGALILAGEAKDPYVKGHSQRVAKYCLRIAKEFDLTKDRMKMLYRAAILHDLGKIGIVDDILNKPGNLNEEERNLVQQHPQMAVDMLKTLKFLNRENDIILHHHEKYDGSGYPDGLKKEEIPFEARILTVADSFDAMNTARAYRSALTKEQIISEFKSHSGTQFDPTCVQVFLEILEKNPQMWNVTNI